MVLHRYVFLNQSRKKRSFNIMDGEIYIDEHRRDLIFKYIPKGLNDNEKIDIVRKMQLNILVLLDELGYTIVKCSKRQYIGKGKEVDVKKLIK